MHVSYVSHVINQTSMDESESLDALSNLLSQLAENPYDISLHAEHIRLVQSHEGLQTQVVPALEMFSNYFAAGEDIWMPLLDASQSNLDLNSASKETLVEVLQLYERAEHDYICGWFHPRCPRLISIFCAQLSQFFEDISSFWSKPMHILLQ
jgi:hypothetical protein